jgi:hypothetical protein
MKKLIMVTAILATVGGLSLASGINNFQNCNGQMMQNQQSMMNNQGQGYNTVNSRCLCNGQGNLNQRMRQGMKLNNRQGCQRLNNTQAMQMMRFSQGKFKQITEQEAKEAVENVIKNNFNGYKITSVDKFQVPMGLLYTVKVKDTKGQVVMFNVNPKGFVVGPFKNLK